MLLVYARLRGDTSIYTFGSVGCWLDLQEVSIRGRAFPRPHHTHNTRTITTHCCSRRLVLSANLQLLGLEGAERVWRSPRHRNVFQPATTVSPQRNGCVFSSKNMSMFYGTRYERPERLPPPLFSTQKMSEFEYWRESTCDAYCWKYKPRSVVVSFCAWYVLSKVVATRLHARSLSLSLA